MDNSPYGSAGSRTLRRHISAAPAPASPCEAHWDRAPSRQGAVPLARSHPALPKSANLRWQTMLRRGPAPRAPRSASAPPVRCRHKVSGEQPPSTGPPARSPSLLLPVYEHTTSPCSVGTGIPEEGTLSHLRSSSDTTSPSSRRLPASHTFRG